MRGSSNSVLLALLACGLLTGHVQCMRLRGTSEGGDDVLDPDDDLGLDAEALAIFKKYTKGGGINLLNIGTGLEEEEEIEDTPEPGEELYKIEEDVNKKKAEKAMDNLAMSFAAIGSGALAAVGSAAQKALPQRAFPVNATEEEVKSWHAENAQRAKESEKEAIAAMHKALQESVSEVRETVAKPEVADTLEPLRKSGLGMEMKNTGARFMDITEQTLQKAVQNQPIISQDKELTKGVLDAARTVADVKSELEKDEGNTLAGSPLWTAFSPFTEAVGAPPPSIPKELTSETPHKQL